MLQSSVTSIVVSCVVAGENLFRQNSDCCGRDSVEGVFYGPLVNRTVMFGRLGPNCLVRGRDAIRTPQEKGCPTLSNAAK